MRGLRTVLAVWFLMNAGFFLIIPLLSVHYVDRLGWAAAFIGLVLAVRQFAQQGLTIFGGALADRVGPRRLILFGVLIRAVSFAVMGFATVPWLLLLSGLLAALGGALFDAPIRATLATLAPEAQLTAVYCRLRTLQHLSPTLAPRLRASPLRPHSPNARPAAERDTPLRTDGLSIDAAEIAVAVDQRQRLRVCASHGPAAREDREDDPKALPAAPRRHACTVQYRSATARRHGTL